MNGAHLLAIAEELRITIVNYVSLPDDLENLRLICKEIEPLATARLYHETTLNLLKWSDGHPLYSNGHRAHRHIRYLIFDADLAEYAERQNSARMENLREGLKQLLRLLPRNFLKGIETPTLLPLDDGILALLASTQKGLISGYFGDERDFTSYQEIIRHSRNLKDLVLRYRGTEPIKSSVDDKAQDTETNNGLISKMMGSQREKSLEVSAKMELSMLVLQGVRLRYADRTFTRCVDFSLLNYLDLFCCPGAAKLLDVLTAQFRKRGNSIKGLALCVERTDEFIRESFNADVLLAFINCLSRLNYISLQIWSLTSPFELNWISAHAETLERLYISIGWTNGSTEPPFGHHIVPLDEFRHLCRTFTKLQQLAIALPEVHLSLLGADKTAVYDSYLNAMACSTDLKILRIFTWPIASMDCILEHESEKWFQVLVFDRHMEVFAQRVAAHLAEKPSPSKLKLVCFGDTERMTLRTTNEDFLGVKPRCYVVERKEADEGAPKISRVTPTVAQFHVPDCSAWHIPYGEHMEDD